MSAHPPTHVRSFSKINLGLAIGPLRPDGFHALLTLYQTLAAHDVVSVVARPARQTRLTLRSNDRRVPTDGRNTVWKMTERVLLHLHRTAEVTIHIQKNLPIQGGMGAGSANAAAALWGLERQLGVELEPADRLRLAAEVGSDVPLFLLGGAVWGTDHGQAVAPAPAVTLGGSAEIPCVVALPRVGVSTPQAFRDWDALLLQEASAHSGPDLHNPAITGTVEKLSQTYATVFPQGTRCAPSDADAGLAFLLPPENLQGAGGEQHRPQLSLEPVYGMEASPDGDSLSKLAAAGIRNDFEQVVFRQHPALGGIRDILLGTPGSGEEAVYAALSGSGSAVFGLYRTAAAAQAAQQRLTREGIEALVTTTLPRPRVRATMFAV